MKEGWMKNDEEWKMNDEGWWFQAVEGFCFKTDERTDICDCRVAFATEKTFITGMHDRNCRILLTKHMLASFP